MRGKKTDKIEIYAFVGLVCLICFLGYDGFVYEDVAKRVSNKTAFIKSFLIILWEIGDKYPLPYYTFRGAFLMITLFMGYKIIKVVRKKRLIKN